MSVAWDVFDCELSRVDCCIIFKLSVYFFYDYFLYHFRTLMKTVPVIIAFWVFSFAVSSPSLFIAKKIVFFGDDVCLNYWQKPWGHKTYAVSMFVFLYVIPQCVLAVCYFRIGNRLWFSVRFQGRPQGTSLQKLRTRRRVVKMVIIVTAAFAVCWLPVHVVELYMAFGRNFSKIFYELKLLAPLVPHLFIATNPIIYCFMSKTFRLHFKAACTCTTTLLTSLSIDDPDGNMHDQLEIRRAKSGNDYSLEVTNKDISTQTCPNQHCDNSIVSNNNARNTTSFYNHTSSSSVEDSSRKTSPPTFV